MSYTVVAFQNICGSLLMIANSFVNILKDLLNQRQDISTTVTSHLSLQRITVTTAIDHNDTIQLYLGLRIHSQPSCLPWCNGTVNPRLDLLCSLRMRVQSLQQKE